jgi:hypothetical protein
MWKLKILVALCGYLFFLAIVDVIMAINHEREFGPYTTEVADVVYYDYGCERDLNNTIPVYNLKLVTANGTYKTETPFIGLYPLTECVFGFYFPTYDRDQLLSITEGDVIEVIADSQGDFYLGKTNRVFGFLFVLLTFALLVAVVRLYKRKKLLSTEEINEE